MNRLSFLLFSLIAFATTIISQNYQPVSVSSINLKDQADSYPYLSHDGLRMYFTRENDLKTTLYVCNRESVNKEFTNPQVVDAELPQNAYSLWMNKEETKIFFIAESNKLFSGSRLDLQSPFSTNPFTEIILKDFIRDYTSQPSLTPDESELYMYASSESREIVSFRKTAENEYSMTKVFSDDDFGGKEVAPGQLSKDGLRFYFSIKNNVEIVDATESIHSGLHQLAFMERKSLKETFKEARFMESSFQNSGIDNFQPTISADNKTLLWVVTVSNSWSSNDFRMATTEITDASEVVVDAASEIVKDDNAFSIAPAIEPSDYEPEEQTYIIDPTEDVVNVIESDQENIEDETNEPISEFFIPQASQSSVAESYPWISDDGLRLYYTRGNTIYFSNRNNVESSFTNPKPLDDNLFDNVTSCWLSPDELSIYYVTGSSTLNIAKRNSITEKFSTADAIVFKNKPEGNLFGPSFTPDMKELWMYNYNGVEQIVSFSKTGNNEYTFSGVIDFGTDATPTAGQFSKDGLRYYVPLRNVDDNEMKLLYVVSRTTTGSPFSLPQLVETTKPIDITAYQPSISGNGKCLIFVTGSKNQWTNNNLCEAQIVSKQDYTPSTSSGTTNPVANSESKTTENSVQNASVFVSNVTAAPNPFITNTNISFSLLYDNAVKVSLIDITGKVVFESEVQNLKKGLNNYNIDRNNLAAGVYYAIIESGSDKRFLKLIIR